MSALQGTWRCSLAGDCSWNATNDSSVGLINLLRLLRFFRIVWILKHLKSMRFSVVLGELVVSSELCEKCSADAAANIDLSRQPESSLMPIAPHDRCTAVIASILHCCSDL